MTDREQNLSGRANAPNKSLDFGKLWQRYYPGLVTHLSRRLGNLDEARELAQDVFLIAFERLEQFDPEKGAFSTWLNRIAFTEFIRYKEHTGRLKRGGGFQRVDLKTDEQGEEGMSLSKLPSSDRLQDEVLEGRELMSDILTFLETLQGNERRIITLRLQDKTNKEIAELLSISQSNVSSKIHSVRKKFLKRFKK